MRPDALEIKAACSGVVKPFISSHEGSEWSRIVPRPPGRGRPVIYPRRDVVDAIRYLDRTGYQWDALPADFPHPKLVYHYFKT